MFRPQGPFIGDLKNTVKIQKASENPVKQKMQLFSFYFFFLNVLNGYEKNLLASLAPTAWVHVNLLGYYQFYKSTDHSLIDTLLSQWDWKNGKEQGYRTVQFKLNSPGQVGDIGRIYKASFK